ncbi:unnamed protein product [Ceutorhynchus assimilis]|uniref:Protein MCM10 homolog n=1 Tax=Ceutorhynchus assimilis TaxID=467358 RepID=A0A9N9MFJ8_9CUCU|nr:unnamed protein product [Ceutorhynchus assimilis]
MDVEDDPLLSLLAAVTEELPEDVNSETLAKAEPPTSSKRILKDADIFQDIDIDSDLPTKPLSTVIHNGDTDSSDDEGNRNFELKQYNECGQEIKRLLTDSISPSHYGAPKQRIARGTPSWLNKAPKEKPQLTKPSINQNKKSQFGEIPPTKKEFQDVLIDPHFSLRIVNPKISSAVLQERMQGRLAVKFSDLSRQIFAGNLKDKDWVISGVVIHKSPPKTSQKGSEYSIWTLCDLKDDMKTVGLFMFSSAHKELWKTMVGSVVGVLNPGILERRDGSKDQATLSVDTAQKVMVLGQSKDYGICKSMKKNGEKCTAAINLSICEFCIYHIKQEYQKCSKRSELQANFAGKGLVNLRNKVLGKNEVFYAGKSYMAIPAKKSKKLESRDSNILQNLSSLNPSSHNISKTKKLSKTQPKGMARHLDVNPAQRARDLELLQKLGGPSIEAKTNFTNTQSEEVTLESSKATAIEVISKLKAKTQQNIPVKKPQYDLKGDLFVNVDNKRSFSGKTSETLSLEDSKNTALSVITKLKAKNGETKKLNVDENEGEMMISLEEFEDELNYSDNEENLPGTENVSNFKNSKFDAGIPSGTPKSGLLTENVSNDKSIGSSKPGSSKELLTPIKKTSIIGTPKPGNSKEPFTPNGNITPGSRKTSIGTPKFGNSKEPLTPNGKITSGFGKTSVGTPRSGNLDVKESADVRKTSFGTPKSANLQEKNTNIKKTTLFESTPSSTLPKNSLNKSALDNLTMNIPTLSGSGKTLIDLNKPIARKHVDRAKVNAIKFIQRNGPIKKVDPNNTRGSGSKKRTIESLMGQNPPENNNHVAKKSKLQESEFISDRFKKMMAMTSMHQDLLQQHDDMEEEKYFNKLEIKEKMEDKMANTHKVKCKAVKCLQCKYTSFSASDLCKSEHHALKVFDAMKRFYKCSNCQNRTVTLELIPTRPCTNCGGSNWQKTGMMKEKIAKVQHSLSIRGGEQKFVNSHVADANLDLLVPDD